MTVQLLLDHIRPILEGSKDGTLLLGNQSEIIKVFCRQGLIEAVSSNLEQYHLGQHLVTEGFMEASAVQPLLAESRRQGVPIGEAALRSKLLEPAELVDVSCSGTRWKSNSPSSLFRSRLPASLCRPRSTSRTCCWRSRAAIPNLSRCIHGSS